MTPAEARAARDERVAQLKKRIFRHSTATQKIEIDDRDEAVSLLVSSNASGDAVGRQAWVVNEVSESLIPAPLGNGRYSLKRSPVPSLLTLEYYGSSKALIRVGPDGTLTTAMVPAECHGVSRVAETVCGGEVLCLPAVGVLGEQEPSLEPSACIQLRNHLVQELPQRATLFRELTLAKVAQVYPKAGDDSCQQATDEDLARLQPKLKALIQTRYVASVRENQVRRPPGWVLPDIIMFGGCLDGKGNYLLRTVVDLVDVQHLVTIWRVNGMVAKELGSHVGTGTAESIGDLDGDGASEIVTPRYDSRLDVICRLYSLTMKPRDIPQIFCQQEARPVVLSGSVALVQDEAIWGLDKGTLVELKGPGPHESLQRELIELASRRASTMAFLESLLHPPAGWEHRETADSNPVRASWAKAARATLLAAGLTEVEASCSAATLAGLGACKSPLNPP